jgi:hypothetical protein
MARIRTIKPEFFMDEDLAELSPLHRLLFIGLWTEADREGRMQDRPRTLKAKLLPWEGCDIEPLLGDLDRAGLIHRYEVGGAHFIAIPGFTKHQRPHPKETGCGYPPPPSREKKRQAANARPTMLHATRVVTRGEGKEILDNGKESLDTAEAVVRPPPPPPDAAEPPLRELLDADFLAAKGSAYAWTFADETAVGALLGKGSEEEIRRRWRIALVTRFPRCTGICDLNKHWNSYATDEPTNPGRAPDKPKDIRRGTVRAEDQAHLHGPAGEHPF